MNITFRRFLEQNPDLNKEEWFLQRLIHCKHRTEETIGALQACSRELTYFNLDLEDVIELVKGEQTK